MASTYRPRIGPWIAKKEILEKLGVQHPMVFDVGAHHGNVTEFYLRMWDDLTVHCFEPEAQALERLMKRYGEDPRIHIHPYAVGAKTYKSKTLYVGGQDGEMSSLRPRPGLGVRRYYRHHLSAKVRVPVVSLDMFCERHEIPRIHVLKMDIQGGEVDALKGAVNLLGEQNIFLIYTEVLFVEMYRGCGTFHEMMHLLAKHGYELFDIYSLGRAKVNRRLKYGDVMFINQAVIEKVLDTYPEEWLLKSHAHAMGA